MYWLKRIGGAIGITLGAAIAVFLSIWLYGAYKDWRTERDTNWKAKYELAEDSAKIWKDSASKRLVRYETVEKPVYLRDRDVVLANPSTPASTRAAFKACDVVLSACDSAQAALKGQVRTLETQIDLLEHKPGPPRVQAYGEAMYDVLNQRPVIRAGGTGKIIGPIHLSAAAEYAVPSAVKLESGSGFRLTAGLRVNF